MKYHLEELINNDIGLIEEALPIPYRVGGGYYSFHINHNFGTCGELAYPIFSCLYRGFKRKFTQLGSKKIFYQKF
ncbi:MAG: hypothetical protein ACTSO9_01005 [Candidatus Helarchaeota archaeon]